MMPQTVPMRNGENPRRLLLEDCVESQTLLCPAHFPGANAGYIKRQGDSFKIEWDR